MFNFPPFTIEQRNSPTPQGIEANIIKTVSESLGFKSVKFQKPSDGGRWGRIYSNGTWTGLLRDIKDGVVHVGSAQFFNIMQRNGGMDPTEFWDLDGFCFVLKKPDPLSKWIGIIKPYRLENFKLIQYCLHF